MAYLTILGSAGDYHTGSFKFCYFRVDESNDFGRVHIQNSVLQSGIWW